MTTKGVIFDWGWTLFIPGKGIPDHVPDILRRLKESYVIGLVTIAGRGIEERWKDITNSNLQTYFDAIIVDREKTPDHYVRCMEMMGTIPSETVIVDDRIIRGIRIGNVLGCRTYWISKGPYGGEIPKRREDVPFKTIDSVLEFYQVFMKEEG